MTAPATDTATEPNTDTRIAPIPYSDHILEVFAAMVEAIPEAEGGGMEAILEQIAEAQTLAELDAPWKATGLGTLVGERIMVTGAKRLPSDFTDGLGWFLVLRVLTADGESRSVTTGAVAVVGQVAKAFQLGAVPFRCIPREAKKPTPDGYRPLHLEMLP